MIRDVGPKVLDPYLEQDCTFELLSDRSYVVCMIGPKAAPIQVESSLAPRQQAHEARSHESLDCLACGNARHGHDERCGTPRLNKQSGMNAIILVLYDKSIRIARFEVEKQN